MPTDRQRLQCLEDAIGLAFRFVIGEPTYSSTYRYIGIGGNEDSGAAHSSQELECEIVIYSICLGVLQFTYFDDEKKRYNGKRFY